MRVKSMLTVGFLSLVAATGAVNVSESFAADAQRVDVIDRLPAEGVQPDSTKTAGDKVMRVDVIDSIGSQGPVYPSTSGSMRVDVIDSIRA